MFTLSVLTEAEVAEQSRRDNAESAEILARWPLSQHRPRCLVCGCFMKRGADWYTRCGRCGESMASQQ